MSKFHVFQDDSGILTCENIAGEYVGSFEADCHCDKIMAIININDGLEKPDPFWTRKRLEIEENGI